MRHPLISSRTGAYGMAAALALTLLVQSGRAAAEPGLAGPPVASFTGGFGTSLGWAGLQGEAYGARGRLSAFGAVGYATGTSDPAKDLPRIGVAFAAGGRAFTRGQQHRAFVEVSYSLLGREWRVLPDRLESVKRYGSGLQVGYQLVKPSGFTFLASAGAGYAPGAVTLDKTQALFGIAVGHTWRRGRGHAPPQPSMPDPLPQS